MHPVGDSLATSSSWPCGANSILAHAAQLVGEVANDYAPEHCSLITDRSCTLASSIWGLLQIQVVSCRARYEYMYFQCFVTSRIPRGGSISQVKVNNSSSSH